MGTDAVADMLPLFQMSSLFFDLQWSLVDLIVIFSVGSVGSLYISVELGTSRGKVVVRYPLASRIGNYSPIAASHSTMLQSKTPRKYPAVLLVTQKSKKRTAQTPYFQGCGKVP